MEIAKRTLEDVSYRLPDDLDLALRAYGNTSNSNQINCADSSLLVPFGEGNRERIRYAISGLTPHGSDADRIRIERGGARLQRPGKR